MINLSDSFTGRNDVAQSIAILAHTLRRLPAIQEADFSDNALGEAGVIALLPFLATACPLQVLKLNNTGLGPGGCDRLACALLAVAADAEPASLISIEVSRSRLETGSIALSEALGGFYCLCKVNVAQNGINGSAMAAVLRSLKQLQLESVNSEDNVFNRDAVNVLVGALPHWPELENLNIASVLVGDDHLELVQALAGCPKLKTLSVAAKDFSQDSGGEWVRCLMNSSAFLSTKAFEIGHPFN
jgi:Ran GTPase-activating protein 1